MNPIMILYKYLEKMNENKNPSKGKSLTLSHLLSFYAHTFVRKVHLPFLYIKKVHCFIYQ